jgi:hypothetical protein
MPFFKKFEIRDAQEKYGFSHQGVFAKELIKKGEAIFTCDLSICDYLKIEQVEEKARTREQTVEIENKHPNLKEFIHKYSYMVDDDLYDWPRDYLEEKLNENCMFFNHSCDPTCGFQALDSSLVVAIRDILPGEELTYDYQCMDTEASLYDGTLPYILIAITWARVIFIFLFFQVYPVDVAPSSVVACFGSINIVM